MAVHLLIPDGVNIDVTTLAEQLSAFNLGMDHVTARRLDVGADVFENPHLTAASPLAEDTATGRITGHIASLNVCHTGIHGVCVTAPVSKRDWVPFTRYDLVATGDSLVAVGRLSYGGNHFGRGSYGQAINYHDPFAHPGFGAVGVDEHGIWFSGTRNDLVADSTVRQAISMPQSGDWRRFAGHLELTDVLAVDDPGYPVTGELVASADDPLAFEYLVAVGIVTKDDCGCGCKPKVDDLDLDRITAGLVLTDPPLAPPSSAEVLYQGVSYSFEEQVDGPDGSTVWLLCPLIDTKDGKERDYNHRIAVDSSLCELTGKRWEWEPDTAPEAASRA